MYLTMDLFSPLFHAYRGNTRIKNLFLRHWPQKTTAFGSVFDKLVFYNGSILQTPHHLAIYKLIGTSAEELNENDYEGVEEAWFYLKPYSIDLPEVSNQEVADFINDNSVLNEDKVVRMRYTQKYSKKGVNSLPIVDNEAIIRMVEAGYSSRYDEEIIMNNLASGKEVALYVHNSELLTYDTTVSPVTFISLCDPTDSVFSSETKIRNKTITPTYNSISDITEYTVDIAIEYTFKRITTPDAAHPLMGVIDEMISWYEPSKFAFYKQVEYMLDAIKPTSVLNQTYDRYGSIYAINLFSDASNDEKSINVEAAENMKSSDFVDMIMKSIDTDYKKKKAKGWAGVLGAIYSIVAIVLSVLFPPFTLIILTLGSLLGMLIQMAIGGVNGMAFGKSLVILQVYSTVTGIANIIKAGLEKAATTATTISQQAINEAGADMAIAALNNTTSEIILTTGYGMVAPTLSNYVSATVSYAITSLEGVFSWSGMSTMEIMNSSVEWMNRAFKVYTEVIAPIEEPPTPPEEVQPLEDNIDAISLMQSDFNTYGFIDLNQTMDDMPARLTTSGLEQKTLCTYYNAL